MKAMSVSAILMSVALFAVLPDEVGAGCICIFRCRGGCSQGNQGGVAHGVQYSFQTQQAVQQQVVPEQAVVDQIVAALVTEALKKIGSGGGLGGSGSSEQLNRMEQDIKNLHSRFDNFEPAVRDMGQSVVKMEQQLKDNAAMNSQLQDLLQKIEQNTRKETVAAPPGQAGAEGFDAQLKKVFDDARKKNSEQWETKMKAAQEAMLKAATESISKP